MLKQELIGREMSEINFNLYFEHVEDEKNPRSKIRAKARYAAKAFNQAQKAAKTHYKQAKERS